ncbi:PAS domain S-box protein [Litoribaculum gwangyangense]|uniref:histidine kinase n=1 Tax=Litoribaculum gwangyangense TaxID=1130722 RepID=A0ABP9CLG6_9FLAO
MSQEKIDILERALARERAARKQAEKILESKSEELYKLTQQLKESNTKLEKLVREKTSELKGVFENIVDAYIVMDLSGNVIKMNDPAIELLGYDNKIEEFNLLKLADSSEVDNIINGFHSLFYEGHITNFEVRINTKYNEQKLVHINASIIIDEQNNPIAAQGIVRDITTVRAAEEKLIQSEDRLTSLILSLDVGILLEDENRKIVLTNNKFCEFFQIPASPEQLIGLDCSNSAEESKHFFENPESFVDDINKITAKRETVLGEVLTMVNGKIFERDYIPIFSNNEYKGHLWSYKDVTLRLNYKKSIESQRKKYRDIIANMNLGLIEVDNDDVILMINHSFSEMSGYTEAELIGRKGNEIFPIGDGSQKIHEENKKRLKGISNSYELKVKNKFGEVRHWLISGAPNYNMNGDVTGSIGIHLDITDLKNLQLQKEKLLAELEKSNDELQEYAHIVSHDLKSPLRSIYALVSWIKEDNVGRLDDTSLENFKHIENSLEKMEQLITTVLNYSKAGVDFQDPEEVDINEMVHDIIEFLYVPKHIFIKILNPLPILKGDKIKLQQVFQNIISNAIKYIDKEKGLVEIDVDETEDYYKFMIRDNGMGIEKQYHEKIFKIFHTLNKVKDSTGLGLSIVKKIVNLHKGDIWLESEPNKGTTFYFTLKKIYSNGDT